MSKRGSWHQNLLGPTTNKHTAKTRASRSTWPGRFSLWKCSAKKRGLTWNITIDDCKEIFLKQNGRCFLTGKALTLEPGTLYTISIDRIDAVKGYEKDNIMFVCWDVNYLRGVMELEKFIRLCNYVSWVHPISRSI